MITGPVRGTFSNPMIRGRQIIRNRNETTERATL
jgi:hypothetical protein